MVADIFQMQVETSQTIEGSAWGAVIIGMKSVGIDISIENKTGKIFFPDNAHKKVYEDAFARFKKVYPVLKDL